MTKKIIGDILALTCLIFAPLTLILNILYAITVGPKVLMKFGVVLILFFVIAFIVSIIAVMRSNRIKFVSNKRNLFIFSAMLFSALSVLINAIAWIMQSEQSGSLWNVYTITTLAVFSFAFSAVFLYIKPKSFIIHAIIYFLVTAIPYFVILVAVTGFFKGAQVFIPISIYLFIYGIVVTIFAVRKYKKAQKELNEKPYEKQF